MVGLRGRRVRCHWHFHRKMYSLSVYVKGKGWRVIRDPFGVQVFFGKLIMQDIKFIVSPTGRERSRKEGRKNVHAWVEGELLDFWLQRRDVMVPCGRDVWYSPFAYSEPAFKVVGGPEIHKASMAALGCSGMKPAMKVVG